MYRVKLPALIGAGDNKDKPSLIEITSAKMTVDDGQGGKTGLKFGKASYVDAAGKEHIGIPAQDWEYPQFGPEPTKNDKGVYQPLSEDQAKEAVDEMIKDAGGIVAFAENYNDATKKAALNDGKNYIRTKEDGDPDSIVLEGLRRSREFTWAASERVTNKSVREGAEKLVEEIDSLSPDEAKKRLLQLLGRA